MGTLRAAISRRRAPHGLSSPERPCKVGSLNHPTFHVITDYSLGQGGAERMLTRLLRYQGFATGRIVSLKGADPALYRENGSQADTAIALNAQTWGGMIINVFRLAILIRRENPPAILCWMYHAHLIGTLAALLCAYRGAVVWTVRTSLDEPKALALSTRIAMMLTRFVRWRCDGTIYNSQRSCDQHAVIGYGANSHVIANGVDMPQVWIERGSRRNRIGIVARFHPDKDYPTFLRAAAKVTATVPGVQIVASGAGVSFANPAFVSAVAIAGLDRDRLELHDDLQSVQHLYDSLDMLVLSSRVEAFPNVLIEAMSRSVPCITTDVGDAGAIVAGFGEVVPPNDADALAAAILTMVRLPSAEYRRRCHTAAMTVATRYSLATSAEQYATFIERCTNARGKAHRRSRSGPDVLA